MPQQTQIIPIPTAEQGHAKWAQIRARGPIHFIFFWGMLAFGGIVILIDTMWHWETITFESFAAGAYETLQTGLMFGIAIWIYGEWRYTRSEAAMKKKR